MVQFIAWSGPAGFGLLPVITAVTGGGLEEQVMSIMLSCIGGLFEERRFGLVHPSAPGIGHEGAIPFLPYVTMVIYAVQKKERRRAWCFTRGAGAATGEAPVNWLFFMVPSNRFYKTSATRIFLGGSGPAGSPGRLSVCYWLWWRQRRDGLCAHRATRASSP